MSEIDPKSYTRWEIIMPNEPSVDQLAALNGLAGAFGWVVAQRSMHTETARANTYLDAESQSFLDTRLKIIASDLGKENRAARRALNALAQNGAPTVRSVFAIGRECLTGIWRVTEEGAGEAVNLIESRLSGLKVPTRQGDVDTLARVCPSLGQVPWVALRACAVDKLRDTGHETHPSIEDILYRSREELNLGRFDPLFENDRFGMSYPYLKAEALEFAPSFVDAQQRLVSATS